MKPFSQQLEEWLHSNKPKTIAGLVDLASDKGFALIFLVLMSIPALPLPTGGVTHVFEVIVGILAIEMLVGYKKIWLPKKWLKKSLGERTIKNVIPRLIKMIKWLEKYSHPRFSNLMTDRSFGQLIGLLVLIFTVAAAVAPPFSGLDTLPALAVVALSLSVILEDIALVPIGIVVGLVGIGLEITLGRLILDLIHRY